MIIAVPILDDVRKAVLADGRAQRQIAFSSGIHPTTFTAFMKGRRGLSHDTLDKLIDALGVTVKLSKKRSSPARPRPRNK